MPANLSTEQSTYSTCQLSLIDVFTMNQSFSSCIQPVDPFILTADCERIEANTKTYLLMIIALL